VVTYRAIIFDLWRVLVHYDFNRAYRELESLCPHPAAEIPKRLAPTGLPQQFETGLIEPREFHAEITKILGLNVDYERFCGLFCGIFTHTLVPESLLEQLHSRYRLVLLSNTNSIHFDMIRATYSFLRHFDELVLSYEVKAMKPHPDIYRAAIDKARCRPEECFYTDDIAEYVEGARKMGLDAVQFEGAEQLQAEMRARGIL
jgi:putative hydrolase of the HAD superfamily